MGSNTVIYAHSLEKMIEVSWNSVEFGDKVYIAGNLVDGIPTCSYGPHVVIDPKQRLLANSRGKTFFEQWPTLFMERAYARRIKKI